MAWKVIFKADALSELSPISKLEEVLDLDGVIFRNQFLTSGLTVM